MLLTVSCTDNLEATNKNPNLPQEDQLLTYGLFNNANKALMNAGRGAFSSGRMTLPWVQYSAQRNYTEEDRFQYRVSTGDAFFRDHYLIAKDYKTIIDLNTNPATAIASAEYGNPQNQIAAARIMLAYTFSQLVDAFGDVPYYSYGNSDPDFQALELQSGNLTPKYASQAKIYTDLMKELKEASEMIVPGDDIFINGDFLFQDTEKMKRFANSLRLRIANRVKGVIPAAAAHITDAIASGVMMSNNDTVGLTYENSNVFPSPFYVSFYIDNRTDFAISNTFVDLLKGNLGTFGLDPRLQKYAAPITANKFDVQANSYVETNDLSKYRGMPYGIKTSQSAKQRPNTSFWSSNVLKKNYKEILIEYAEVEFLLSENDNWNNTNYQNGVKASMERWGVNPAAITTFLGTLQPANEANVISQKYIALFMQPYEAWSEYRRTGFPNTLLQPNGTYALNNSIPDPVDPVNNPPITTYVFEPLNGLTEMPTRLKYPFDSPRLNGVNYAAAVANMGPDKLDTKLIWDTN